MMKRWVNRVEVTSHRRAELVTQFWQIPDRGGAPVIPFPLRLAGNVTNEKLLTNFNTWCCLIICFNKRSEGDVRMSIWGFSMAEWANVVSRCFSASSFLLKSVLQPSLLQCRFVKERWQTSAMWFSTKTENQQETKYYLILEDKLNY